MPGACSRARPIVLLSIPPDADGDPALDRHGADIAALPGLAWIGYLSTTGVYGDTGGAWVDESATPAHQTAERGRRRVKAERGWLARWARNTASPSRSSAWPGSTGRAATRLPR